MISSTIPDKQLANGFSMPIFGMGTWQIGGRRERDFENDDERDIAAIKRAIESGLSHIDTAEIYADGHAEKLVARAIKGVPREKILLASKVWMDHLRHDDVLRSAEQSLSRLETNYLDLYYVHRPHPEIDMSETFSAMKKLVQRGLIRHVAVSNFSAERLSRAQKLIDSPIVANQVHYNLIYREPAATGLLEYCQKNDVLLVAWRPVQKGLLSDSADPILRTIAARLQKTPAQIAINWLIAQDNVVTLSTMRTPSHLDENLGALSWKLGAADFKLLTERFSGQQQQSDAIALS